MGARIEAKKSPLEKAGESSLKTQKFAWSKEGQKSFEWRKIYHALLGPVGGMPEGGIATETLISPTAMRMYTDHRVMGAVVLPGLAHEREGSALRAALHRQLRGRAHCGNLCRGRSIADRWAGPGQHAGGDAACWRAHDLLPLHRSEQGARPDQANVGLD